MLRTLGFALALVFSFLAGTLVPTASTQSGEAPKRYLQAQFMKVNPGMGAEYLALERDLWKPVHQERVNRGLIRSWALYGVHLPGGAVDHNFVVLTELPDFASLENARFPELFSEVQGMDDYEDILQKTYAARTRVRQDIWVLVESTVSNAQQ